MNSTRGEAMRRGQSSWFSPREFIDSFTNFTASPSRSLTHMRLSVSRSRPSRTFISALPPWHARGRRSGMCRAYGAWGIYGSWTHSLRSGLTSAAPPALKSEIARFQSSWFSPRLLGFRRGGSSAPSGTLRRRLRAACSYTESEVWAAERWRRGRS